MALQNLKSSRSLLSSKIYPPVSKGLIFSQPLSEKEEQDLPTFLKGISFFEPPLERVSKICPPFLPFFSLFFSFLI